LQSLSLGNAFLTKYSPDGTKLWTQILETSGDDAVKAIAIGIDGSIYVGGSVGGSLYSKKFWGGGTDGFIAKYSPDGIQLWVETIATIGRDEVSALTIGLDGSLYVGGNTSGLLAGLTQAGYSDVVTQGGYFLKKYFDPWITTSTASVNEGGNAVFKLGAGISAAGTSLDYALTGAGMTSDDFRDGQMSGTVTVDVDGVANISVPILADQLTERNETLIITIDGVSTSVVINDTSIDDTPPTILGLSAPYEGWNGKNYGNDVVLAFSEPVQRGTGYIVLKTAAGVVASYDAATSRDLSIRDNTLTIGVGPDLGYNKIYMVEFAEGTIKDLVGNKFAGLRDYSFTTGAGDIDPPTVITFKPSDEALGVAITANIVLTFSEAIAPGTGDIVLKTSAGVVVASYHAASSTNLSISGSSLTIDPSSNLGYNTGYRLEFAAGTIKDTAGNSYAGGDYNFTSKSHTNALPTGSVTILGLATQGETMTAANTLADVDGIPSSGADAIAYQWSAGGAAIANATGSTYVLTQAEVGKAITVLASYTDSYGTAESKASSGTTNVANINDSPTGSVTITGTATQGQVLTAANTLADVDGIPSSGADAIAYQWSAGGTAISGATSSTYKVTAAQVGKAITVAASYADRHGTAESVASSATDAVQESASISHMTTPASEEFSAALPVGLFDATGIQGPFTYTVTWAHGSQLYGTLGSWLRFDSTALTFSGTPSQAAIGYYPIVITATNAAQESVTEYASIRVYNPLDGNMDITGVGSGNPPDWGLTTKPDSQTVDVTSPVISKSGPLDASVGIATDAVLYFRFSEEVQRGTGDIRLLYGADLVETFHVDTSDQLTLIYDTTLKLTPSRPMLPGGVYTVEFDSQAFQDKAGNALAVGQQVTFSTYDGTSGQRIVVDASDSQGREFLFFSEHSIQGAGQMQGGNGWDCYWIDSLQDRVVDTGTDPKDYDWVSYSFTPSVIDMANFPEIESWRLKGAVTGPITFRGNDLGNEGPTTSFNDTLYGFGGSDQLEGAGGADLMYGGLGDDIFLIENLADKAYESSGEGFDIAYVNGVVGYRFDYDTEIEAVYVGDGASVDLYPSADGKSATLLSNFVNNAGAGAKNAAVTGGDGADGVIGFDGAESISGGGGADLLSGNGGADLIDGGTGDDLMSGGDGADTLVGGLGADIIYSGDGNDSVDAGDGNDLIVGGSGAGDDAYIGGAGIDTIKYTSATAAISVDLAMGTATSTQGNDLAGIGTDTLTGIENIIAGHYFDILVGSALANVIDAGTGNDTVTGGGGDDSIDGGAGTDQAVFGAASANYTVTSTATGITVKDNVGTEGTDTLTNIEAIVFADQTLSFGKTVDIQAYSWKAHTLLEGVAVGIGSTSQSTGSLGSTSFAAITDTAITLSATRTVPSGEATTTSAAVNLQDAIAILKMIVGLNVNAGGASLSPYQALAADFDGNGLVELNDAIGVLKHVVGLTAPDPVWHFVNEIDSTVPGKANLSPGLPQTSVIATLSGGSPANVGLVGFLSGDVDGSFAGADGAANLDHTQNSYFIDLLAANPGLNASQFGVY
jgi:Ca2+-binding RTX toxin-like protein